MFQHSYPSSDVQFFQLGYFYNKEKSEQLKLQLDGRSILKNQITTVKQDAAI
jgi:hypothetical protein